MAEGYMKQRPIGPPRSMSRQANNRRLGKQGGSKRTFPEGMYDRFYPTDIPCWVNINPNASYTYEVYDRDSGEVITVTTTWFEWYKHYVARNMNKTVNGKKAQTDFVCSCGPHRDKPCYGCACRNHFYKRLDSVEERTGFRPKDEAPVSRTTQYSLPVTIMETVYTIPVTDSKGMPKKSKAGKLLYRYIPAPFAESSENADADFLERMNTEFGHRMHWTLGTAHLNQLLAHEEELKGHCGNCAGPLYATAMVCPECEEVTELAEPITGVDLRQECKKARRCKNCKEQGTFLPYYDCPDCGEPTEGTLLSFDIRVVREKTGDRESLIRIVGVRIPGAKDKKTKERIKDLLEHPLDVSQIFAPTELNVQKMIMGKELTNNLSPNLDEDNESVETEPYADSDKHPSNSDSPNDTGDDDEDFPY